MTEQRMILCEGGCGKLIEWKPRRKYCRECANEKHKQDHRRYVKENGIIPKKHMDSMTLCKCPLCGKLHKMRLNWVGHGMPRKYCNNCSMLEIVQSGIIGR